ncbi:MAG: SUMF1/EgtB/PvdO family nonheme iron enzyme [Myxococcales bacterium]
MENRPHHRFARWIAPLATAVAVALVGTLGWAKATKAPKKRQNHPAASASAASGPRATATPKKRPRKQSTTRAATRKSAARGGLTSIVRSAERFVQEGDLAPSVSGGTCPSSMASIDSRYCVDKYEGSLFDMTHQVAWSSFDVVPEGVQVQAISAPGVYPTGYISGATAQNACRNAGKRLCSPVEWRKACYGPDNVLFGYAATRQAGRCNDRGRSPMQHFYPQVNVSWSLVGMVEMNDPQLNQLDGTLMKTGESSGCSNGYGLFDMVGNLHEWTSDPHGTFQGGYYLDTHINGDGCGYRTTAHEFTYHDYSTGFRCCADIVRPSSAVASPSLSAQPAPVSSSPAGQSTL